MSLIEVIVVLAILAMFAAVVSVNVSRVRMKGRITTTQTSIQSIEDALEMYNNETGRFPTEEEGLEVLTRKLNGLEALLEPGQLKDAWGREFAYRTLVDEDEAFEVSSPGDDGIYGNEDDVSNFVSN